MRHGSLGDCTGLWRRTLLIEADGSRDVGTDVCWLQGISCYVDSRGFAGVLHRRGDVFEWQRDIDIDIDSDSDTAPPEPTPDVGEMHWDGDVLVEKGVHADYVEHWVRDAGPVTPVWAMTLGSPHESALLIQVGQAFGWAGPQGVTIGRVGDGRWGRLAAERMDGQLRADGVRWSVLSSEGNVQL
ncbi:hypothetical protein ACN27E_09650 [Mycobacterium sp. WMMD1722]|uniref:hypothetical protein n=1 Tax=Mycobacterium sp. WMMD1722 TaxID=3404117 RepID=UPI003BF55A23